MSFTPLCRHSRSFHSIARFYSTQLRIMRSLSNDPFVNLATEDYIFHEMDPQQQILFLWRNGPTVVIGKHQNPWKECHVQKLEEDGVNLARRRSGGGAVYHDLGCSIFTFMSPISAYSKEKNFGILTSALKNTYGIEARVSGRNDIVVPASASPDGIEKKISGCAFKLEKDRAFHHGTLLVNMDLDALPKYLSPNKLKLLSKGIASVRSRVINLKELNPALEHEGLSRAIIDEFVRVRGDGQEIKCEVEDVDLEVLQKNPSWTKYYDELRDWNWRFGRTPNFEHQFETRLEGFGVLDVYISSERNIIKDAKIYSDSLFPMIVEQFQESLMGQQYSRAGVDAATSKVKQAVERQFAGSDDLPTLLSYVDAIGSWMAQSL